MCWVLAQGVWIRTRENKREKQTEREIHDRANSEFSHQSLSITIQQTNSSYIIIHHRCSSSVITHQHSSLIIYNIYIIDIIIGKSNHNPSPDIIKYPRPHNYIIHRHVLFDPSRTTSSSTVMSYV